MIRPTGKMGLLALAILGCDPGPGNTLPPAIPVPAGAERTIVIEDQVGAAPYQLMVRSVNAHGAMVPGDAGATVKVDGQNVSVDLSGSGLGYITLDEPGIHRVQAGELTARVAVSSSDWPGFGLPVAFADKAGAHVARDYGKGVIVAAGDQLWQVPRVGRPFPILNTTDAAGINDLLVTYVDGDQFPDVVVWSDTTLYILSGTAEGIPTWYRAYRKTAHTIGGAIVENIDGDDKGPEIYVAWHSVEGSDEGDATQAYSYLERVVRGKNEETGEEDLFFEYVSQLNAKPSGMAWGDNAGEGSGQITVIESNDRWDRFVYSYDEEEEQHEFNQTGPGLPVDVPLDARLYCDGDFNGDGADELFAFGPRVEDAEREVFVIDLAGESGSDKIEYITRRPMGAWLGLGDSQGDDLVDLWSLLDDGTLKILTGFNDRHLEWNVDNLADPGAFTLTDANEDGVQDLFVAGEGRWRLHLGAVGTVEAGDQVWRLKDDEIDMLLNGTAFVDELDIDLDATTVNWIGVHEVGDVTYLKAWKREQGSNAISELPQGRYTLSLVPQDFVAADRCGDKLFVLQKGELSRFDFSTMPIFQERNINLPQGEAIDISCAYDGEGDGYVAIMRDDAIDLYDDDLALIETLSEPGVQDMVLLPLSGDVDVATCVTENCTVLSWNVNGTAYPVTQDGEGTYLDAAAGEDLLSLPIDGHLQVVDVDGDGHEDLVGLRGDGLVTVLRSMGEVTGLVPEWFHIDVELGRQAFVGDADGDGFNDLFGTDAEERLFVAPGAYSEAVSVVP